MNAIIPDGYYHNGESRPWQPVEILDYADGWIFIRDRGNREYWLPRHTVQVIPETL